MNIWNNSEAARRWAAVTLKYEDWAVCSAGIPPRPGSREILRRWSRASHRWRMEDGGNKQSSVDNIIYYLFQTTQTKGSSLAKSRM